VEQNNKNMEQWIINSGNLRDFATKHKLIDKHSYIQFNSLVSIDTARNSIRNKEIVIWINFHSNCSGKLHFLNDNLDPDLYPTEFSADWQRIQHMNNEYLLITGNHTKNPAIGNYTVKITPLGRLRE